MLERKYKMLKIKLFTTTALAAGIPAIPVPGVDDAINTVFLVLEVRQYMHLFGVEQERAYTLKDFENSLLKCKSLFKPNFNTILFVVTKIVTFTALLFATSFLYLILPLIGSVISSVTTARVTYRFLDDMPQNIKDDAVLIYEHIMKKEEKTSNYLHCITQKIYSDLNVPAPGCNPYFSFIFCRTAVYLFRLFSLQQCT
jgi:hypothetical protein